MPAEQGYSHRGSHDRPVKTALANKNQDSRHMLLSGSVPRSECYRQCCSTGCFRNLLRTILEPLVRGPTLGTPPPESLGCKD
jgi:hypothetical protein